jgi:hypothetical protein
MAVLQATAARKLQQAQHARPSSLLTSYQSRGPSAGEIWDLLCHLSCIVPVPNYHAVLHHTVPRCAVLCLQGKVRAISFDHQAQQVVALATDETLSWWTPDLQLKGSARLTNTMEAVAVSLKPLLPKLAVPACPKCTGH